MIIAIILTTIYLSVKPKAMLIQQFFATVLISQIFNFDLLPVSMCGTLGTVSSVLCNGISLSQMPEVIKTRDVSGINLGLSIMSVINLFIWFLYAYVKGDPFMTVSQFLGTVFNGVVLMFYFWATQQITSQDTPVTWFFMKRLIAFFKLFGEKNIGQRELVSLFWHDESSDLAKAHIKMYKNDISYIQ